MKKKILIIATVILIIVAIPLYYFWPDIRFMLGFTIVRSPDGARFSVNEIDLNLVDGTTRADAEDFARSVNGRIVGEISIVNQYLIEVPSRTIVELEALMSQLDNLNDPRIEGVSHNTVMNLIQ